MAWSRHRRRRSLQVWLLAYLAARWRQNCLSQPSRFSPTARRTDVSIAGTLATPVETCHKANDAAVQSTTPVAFGQRNVVINVVILVFMQLTESKLCTLRKVLNGWISTSRRHKSKKYSINISGCIGYKPTYSKIVGMPFVNLTYTLSTEERSCGRPEAISLLFV